MPSKHACRLTQEADDVFISTGSQDGDLVRKLLLLVCILLQQLFDGYCLHTIQNALENLHDTRIRSC